jgi:hypothetical protein
MNQNARPWNQIARSNFKKGIKLLVVSAILTGFILKKESKCTIENQNARFGYRVNE